MVLAKRADSSGLCIDRKTCAVLAPHLDGTPTYRMQRLLHLFQAFGHRLALLPAIRLFATETLLEDAIEIARSATLRGVSIWLAGVWGNALCRGHRSRYPLQRISS